MTAPRLSVEPQPECIESGEKCEGMVEFRDGLSGTGKPFPRCDGHWSKRLDLQDGLRHGYPQQPPSGWSPMDAGESWDEDY
jgi:hypothetical protein